MSQEKFIKLVKYLIIAWLIVAVICGIAYIGLAFLVIELADQLADSIK